MNLKACLLALWAAVVLPGILLAKPFDLDAALRDLASAEKPATLTIPPGTYLLPAAGLKLKKLENVTIHARGVTLIATSFDHCALTFETCRNITLEGVTIDYDPLPFTQGTIVAVDREARRAEFEIHKGYPDLQGAYLVSRVHLFDQATRRWKKGAPDYYLKPTATTPRKGFIDFHTNPSGLDSVEPGDQVAFNIREDAAISIKDECEGLHFTDVTLHASAGLGVIVRFSNDAGTFENLRLVPGPRPQGAEEERLLSTCADGMNIAYTRKGPVLKSCEFSYMGDDGLNLHGVTFPVLKWLDAQTFLTMRPQRGEPFERIVRAGDDVRFLEPPFFKITASAKVESFQVSNEDPALWLPAAQKIWPTFKAKSVSLFTVRLDRKVEVKGENLFCEIPQTAAPGYLVEGCYFHDHRARGLRLMAGDGLVRANRFERIKGVAISIGPEFGYWREAGWCDNVQVLHNVLRDIGEGANVLYPESNTLGAISTMCHIEHAGAQGAYFPGNEKIRIERNVIEGCSVDAISIVAAKDVSVRGNTARKINLRPSPESGSLNGLSRGRGITVIDATADVADNVME